MGRAAERNVGSSRSGACIAAAGGAGGRRAAGLHQHARLTAAAIAADGLQCIGWIANEVDPQMERVEENIGMLRQRLAMPCWGRIPWRPDAEAAAQAQGLQLPR